MMLTPGTPLTWWQVTALTEREYDVADAPMAGEMDSTFFLTKDKNIIPHTYPCRTAYIGEARGVEPVPAFAPDWAGARNVLPMGSAFLDLSGFWYRATRLGGWARTAVTSAAGGPARLRLSVAGAAKLFVNGVASGWLAPARRNAPDAVELDVTLQAGRNELAVWFEDLAERDAVVRIELTWLDGSEADEALPFDAAPETVLAVAAAIEAMHLDAKHYDGDDIWLEMPVPFPGPVVGRFTVTGDFMAHDAQGFEIDIPAGAARVKLCNAAGLRADYRYFHFDLACAGFATQATLGAEITNLAALGSPAATLEERIDTTLGWIAANAEADTQTALACLDLGTPEALERAEAIIAHELTGIERCHDCADFALVPLIWGRTAYGDRITAALRDRIDAAMLAYRYWMDEPGNDVQWYFSENHALLFHTAAYLAGRHLPEATFARSGRSGAAQSATGKARLDGWFDHFEAAEMAEFNSAPYFPIDLKGLAALWALAPDADIKARAGAAIARLIEIVANSAHHGVLTAAQGRSYEHTLCTTTTMELSGLARLLWGLGGYGAHVNALAEMALALRDHGLARADLAARASWPDDGTAQEWRFTQGKVGDAPFARLYHHKSAHTAMGSAARYRWGDWGYQETLIHARIGRDPRAQIWINHPGEMKQSGYGRPSFWGGSANVPRVQQYRDLALILFAGEPPQLDFTHAWFPTPVFDDWTVEGHRAAARSGAGLLTIAASGPLDLQARGGAANHELRLAGRDGLWLVRLGAGDDLAAFSARHRLAAARSADGTITIDDPDYGPVVFAADGTVRAEGRVLDPGQWTREGDREVLPLPA
ncbi:MAG: hypothetical protein KDK53_05060 [Maritimibacter sp.]|nr:hypothetical protein [Maritimibacter sp.]